MRLGLRVLTLRPVHEGEGVEGDGVVCVAIAELLLHFGQRGVVLSRRIKFVRAFEDGVEIDLLRRRRRMAEHYRQQQRGNAGPQCPHAIGHGVPRPVFRHHPPAIIPPSIAGASGLAAVAVFVAVGRE
jgi:hypothetical protein